MEQSIFLRLTIVIASSVLAMAGGCTKQAKRSESGGKTQVEDPSEKPSTSSNPCLRIKLQDDEDDKEDDDEDEPDDEEGKDEDADQDADTEKEDEDGIGASTSSSDCEDPEPSTPTPSGEKIGGGYNVGPGIPGCEEKNEAWIAVKSGGPGQCGGKLVNWCCSASEIASRFPNVAAKLTPKIDDIVSGGLKLYHCSEDAGKTTFHFAASKDGGGVQYKTLYVSSTNSKEGDTKGESCAVVTMEDMGFTKSTTDDAGTVTTTESIPKSIGELLDTSKAALLDFLKAEEYKAWTHDAAVRATTPPHGDTKIFFNAKLKASMDADKIEHDVGSIVVKEIYKANGTVIDGYAIMAKHKAGEGKDTWFFYEALGEPDFKDVKAYAVGGPAMCVDCHKSGKDFIKATLPP